MTYLRCGDGTSTHLRCSDGTVTYLRCSDGTSTHHRCSDGTVTHLRCGDGTSTHLWCSDGTSTHMRCFLCCRTLISDVQSRLKPSSFGAGSGEEQNTKNYLATIQNDVKTLLSRSKVCTPWCAIISPAVFHRSFRWRFGVVVTRRSQSIRLTYAQPS